MEPVDDDSRTEVVKQRHHVPAAVPPEPPTETLTAAPPEPATEVLVGQPNPESIPTPAETPPAVPTELRVHGVSGTPAEETLDRAVIGRVAGDTEAGFYRPRPEYGAATTVGPGGARLEAYRWGNLTAGAAARAFWLLLLPFSLANLPMWMRPPATGFGRRIVHALCRLFALTMSGTFVLAAIGVCLDLVAWQCAAPGSRCLVDRPWLTWLFTGFFEPTGRRIALASIGPIILVAVLWFLGRRTWARYEAYALPARNPDGDGLATPSFWDGREQVSRLRSVHIAAMFAVVAAVLMFQLRDHDQSTNSYAGMDLGMVLPTTVVRIGDALFWAAITILVLCLLAVLLPPIVDRVSKSRTAAVFVDLLLWGSILLTVAALVYGLVPRTTWPTVGPLPGYGDTVTALFAAQVGLLALLLLVILFQRHRAKGALLAGFAAPVVASLGLGLGAAFSAGVSYRVADYLDGAAVPSPAEFSSQPQFDRLQPPISYQWAAFGFVLMLLIVLLAAIWIRYVTKPILRRRARENTDEDYPGGRARDPLRAKAIDRAIANARLTDHISRSFAVAWFILGALGVGATAMAVLDIGPVQLAPSGSVAAGVISVLANAGTYLISFTAFLLVLLGIQTYRNPRVRRTVGVIWDLATFWPRAAHPLGPPCYAERVVPELVHRASWLATEQGGVVLSGHSQGSVLVAATVLQMPQESRARTALLTYGSPLARLYCRLFPNYFNEKVTNDIGTAVAGANGQERWINLWRRTDPIGGAVGIADRRLADPSSFDPLPGDRLPPAVAAHSGYQVTPQFGRAVDDLLGLLSEHRQRS